MVAAQTRIATDGAFAAMIKERRNCLPQQANGIGADGIVGPQTWGVLMSMDQSLQRVTAGAPVAPSAPSAPAATGNSAKSAGASSSSSSVLATQQRINACLRSKGISCVIAEDGVWGPQESGWPKCPQSRVDSLLLRQFSAGAEATAEKRRLLQKSSKVWCRVHRQPAKRC